MLDGETGYEGRFDFARRIEAPALSYLLATVPRTGSTWFSHLLWRTGCLGAPLEYLNFEPLGPYYFAARSGEQQLLLWQSLLHRRTSPNGVFGLKAFPMQMQALQDGNPTLLNQVLETVLPRSRARKVVFLGRRDRVAHAVSHARATLSGVWRSEQEKDGGAQVRYSQTAVDNARQGLDLLLSTWESMFKDLQIEPLRLWYEDVVENPDAAVRQVADHVGVTLDPAAEVAVPEIRRQAQDDAQTWAKLHAGAEHA